MGITGYVTGGTTESGGGGGGTGVTLGEVSTAIKLQEFTLSVMDIANGYVTVSNTIADVSETKIGVVGGMSAFNYGTDFTALGTQVTWNGLGLDGLLSVGDVINVEYFTTNP